MKPIAYIILLLGIVACTPQVKPQRPTRLGEKTSDIVTPAEKIQQANRELALAADEEVQRYIDQQEIPFERQEAGYWLHKVNPLQAGRSPQAKETCTLFVTLCQLNGNELDHVEGTYTLEQDPLPKAILDATKRMYHGESAILVCPWYTAFGAQGNEHVQAYENVIIYLDLL